MRERERKKDESFNYSLQSIPPTGITMSNPHQNFHFSFVYCCCFGFYHFLLFFTSFFCWFFLNTENPFCMNSVTWAYDSIVFVTCVPIDLLIVTDASSLQYPQFIYYHNHQSPLKKLPTQK